MINRYGLFLGFMVLFVPRAAAQEQMTITNAINEIVSNVDQNEPLIAVSSSETTAIENLKKLSNAAEIFASAHGGEFPTSIDDFTTDQYEVNAALCMGTDGHYRYECSWQSDKYEIKAISVDSDQRSFKIVTGGELKEISK